MKSLPKRGNVAFIKHIMKEYRHHISKHSKQQIFKTFDEMGVFHIIPPEKQITDHILSPQILN